MDRVALYLVSFSGGGAEREMIYLANEFLAKGYNVDLIVHRNKGPLASLVSKGVNIHTIDRTYVQDAVFLARYMRNNRPIFILSTLHVPNWTLSIAKFISFTHTKIAWRIVISLTDSKKDSRGVVSRLLSVCYPILSRNVDNVTCVSKGVADDLIKNFSVNKDKVNVMYNPAYTESIHKLGMVEVEHPWFSADYKTVVSLGRLSTQKDFNTLIDAFKLVHDSAPESRLFILGEGNLRGELQARIDALGLTNVATLYGFELNPYKYLANADLFVLSSIYEGFGNVIVEALALNVPVVSTDCPSGPAEILNDGEWGQLVPVKDINKLAEAMLLSLNKSKKKDTLIRAKEFSVETVVDKYIQLMK